MNCFSWCIPIKKRTINIKQIESVNEEETIMKCIQNYDTITDEQFIILETMEKRKIIEIVRLQNHCLHTLMSLLT